MVLATSASAKILPESTLAEDTIVNAIQQGQVRPVFSAKHMILEPQAYEIQHRVVEFLNGALKPSGYKAGLTTPGAQKKFGADGPVAGVLIAGSLRESGGKILTVDRALFLRPMFEVEIGYRFSRAISEPVASIEQLKSLVASIAPVVELPDLAFEDLKAVKVTDIIANNVLARQLIAGIAEPPSRAAAVNGITVSVYRDGKSVMQGLSGQVMGNQWEALLWLVNHTVKQGYIIEPDQICITGAISGMAPLLAGQYVADFGSLGVIRFTAH